MIEQSLSAQGLILDISFQRGDRLQTSAFGAGTDYRRELSVQGPILDVSLQLGDRLYLSEQGPTIDVSF